MSCRALEGPLADRWFESLSEKFVIAHLDTRNGRADFVPILKLSRNMSYVLVLSAAGKELAKLENPTLLEEAVLLVDSVAPGEARVTLTLADARPIKDREEKTLESHALALLQTSRINSATNRVQFRRGLSGVHAAYRKAMAGDYMLLAFDLPRRLKSIGGDVTALELVIAVERDDRVKAIFSIDMEGRVIQHAQFEKARANRLLAAVKRAASHE